MARHLQFVHETTEKYSLSDRQTDRIFIDVKSLHGLICHRNQLEINLSIRE